MTIQKMMYDCITAGVSFENIGSERALAPLAQSLQVKSSIAVTYYADT